jgi:DNA-binding IclR family transcriptional regulator
MMSQSIMRRDKTISYSALEFYLLDTLRNRLGRCATIAELAQATTLPTGTVHMGLQWLLACGDIEWVRERECYQATIAP